MARLARPHTYATDRLGFKLHPKQSAVLKDLFVKGSRVSVRCANEVGKTSHIGVAAILYALEILGAQAISTAGVWMQVAQQLVPALKRHSHRFPSWDFQETAIKINGVDRYVGFSTRDEGFAQGFHRRDGMPLLGIVDEAAAVKPQVISGIEDRCNPDYFLIMGSPLDPAGAFYDIETSLSKFYSHHHISQLDCLEKDGYWMAQAAIDRKIQKYGQDNPFVQSNVFGEFSQIVAGALLSLSEFDACLESEHDIIWERQEDRHAFFDFAAGRNKNVFAIRVGTKVWVVKKWTDFNTMSACGEFLALFRKMQREYGLRQEEVDGDADGLGLPMIHRLREMGLHINAFHGGGKPRFNDDYANAVSEAWGEGAGMIKRKTHILPRDADFKAQALGRKLKRNSAGKFQLEPKEDMIKRGLESPDEADALFGAMMPKVAGPMMFGGASPPPASTKDSIWQERDTGDKEPILPGTHFG